MDVQEETLIARAIGLATALASRPPEERVAANRPHDDGESFTNELTFYLGVHEPGWLGKADVPLFLSFSRLARRQKIGRGRWAVDSGGFSELQRHGRWTIAPERYTEQLRRLSLLAGPPDFAAIQDWMCEPFMLAKTGLTIEDHQRRSIASYIELQRLAPEITWAPVLQGWGPPDYERHLAMYQAEGFELETLPVVGVGSVCRRQATVEAVEIFRSLADHGLRMHAFGLKRQGLSKAGHFLVSADSMAWSFGARRDPVRLPGHSHRNCANCLEYALIWRTEMLTAIENKQAGGFRLI